MIPSLLSQFSSNTCPFNLLISNPKCNLNIFPAKIIYFSGVNLYSFHRHIICYTIISSLIWELLFQLNINYTVNLHFSGLRKEKQVAI